MRAITRVKIKIHIRSLPQYIIVLANLFVNAWIYDKWLEAVCFAISYLVLRYQFTDTYHCKTTFRCILATNTLVFVSIPVILPITSTMFGGLFVGFVVTGGLNLFASHLIREKERIELNALKQEKRERDVYSMSEDELRDLCKSYNFDQIDEAIVIFRLIYHLKGQDLYDKIGYSKRETIRREKKIEEILEVPLK